MVLGERWSSAVLTLATGVSSTENAYVSCYTNLLQVSCDKSCIATVMCAAAQAPQAGCHPLCCLDKAAKAKDRHHQNS